MARPDDEKTDGLEIISIGALYDGPWDKKYWSSSRGKDRYPHPVGYRAMRTHNGITYKMEILEGLKGPLFTINSTDGHSCSGQTPEIAWESFQKKGCSRLKVWRGKRFSGKVDGVEFFGLKNPYVQRLLRELVANGNGTAEPRLLSTPICNETTRTKHNTECTEPGTSPDLSPCILKPAVAVKSRKHKISYVKSDSKVSLKRPKTENQNQRVDASSSTQRTERNHIHGSSFTSSASKKEKESPQDLMPTLEAVNVTEDKKHLVRSEDIEEQEESPSKTVYKDREVLVPNDQAINDMDLCAPDTLDLSLDDTSNVVVDIPKESSHDVKYEVLAAQKVISEDLATDSPPEAETIASTANENSEKNEHDSIGGDVANSMMTVLLPKALPLLKTFSRKKKVKTRAQEKSNRPDQSADIVDPVGLHIASTDLCSRVSTFGDVTSVSPDSFENDQLENPVTDESRLSKSVAEGDQTTIGACQGSAARHIETNDSKINSCSKVQLDSMFFDFGDIASVAPDSYEYDQCENPESDRLPLFQDVAVGDQTTEATAGKRDAESIGMEISVQMSQEDISLKTRKDDIDNPLGQCNVPLSESIICRNFPDVCAPEIKREPFGDDARLDPPPHNLHMVGSYVNSEDALCNMGLVTLQSKEIIFVSNCNESSVFSDSFISSKTRSRAAETNIKHDNESNNLQLVGCYLHPMPISLVLLSTKGKETYICVLSGLFMENKTLFIYKVPIEGKMKGSPSFIGHASISLPVSRDAFGREIALDSKSLQLTPDGQCLVLLNCIKAPYCSELKIHCPCSACTSDCFEKNAVKVVQVKQGYVSVVVKLKTTDRVRCILVCEPNYLLAADEGRRLYLWLMNSTWSAQTEECDLPMSDLLTPYIVELKKIPNYAALVVGHNGFGEFILWDISKRIQVSRFSAPSVSVSWVIPVSLFRWKNAGIVPTGRDEEEHINDLIDQIKMYAKRGENHDICPLDGDDVAIWLLISTVPDPDLLHYPSSDCQNNPAGCWKLALLVKNIVVLGNALDPSAFAIGTSLDHGIVGTCDGQVYMWELSTGMKLGHLHSFKDGVSCIATGESTSSGAVAVAGDGGQLRLYIDRSSARDSAT